MVDWPSTLPCQPEQGTWQEAPSPSLASFVPEVGPTIDRRRGTVFTMASGGTFVFTKAEYLVFLAWYRDDLKAGAMPFNFDHPLTGVPARWKFDPKPGWALAGVTNRKVRVAMQLRQLP